MRIDILNCREALQIPTGYHIGHNCVKSKLHPYGTLPLHSCRVGGGSLKGHQRKMCQNNLFFWGVLLLLYILLHLASFHNVSCHFLCANFFLSINCGIKQEILVDFSVELIRLQCSSFLSGQLIS